MLTNNAVKNACNFLCQMDRSERDVIKEEIKKINEYCRFSFLDSMFLATMSTVLIGAGTAAGFMSAGPLGGAGGGGGGWYAGYQMAVDLRTEKVINIIKDLNSDRITRMCAKIRSLSKRIEFLKKTDPKNETERDQLIEARGYLNSRLIGIVIFLGNEPQLVRDSTLSYKLVDLEGEDNH